MINPKYLQPLASAFLPPRKYPSGGLTRALANLLPYFYRDLVSHLLAPIPQCVQNFLQILYVVFI